MPQEITTPSLSNIDACDFITDLVTKINSNFGTMDNPATSSLIGLGSPATEETTLTEPTNDFFWITPLTLNSKLAASGSITPGTPSIFDIGASANSYANGYFDNLDFSQLTADGDVITISGTSWYINGTPMTIPGGNTVADHDLSSHQDILFPAPRSNGKILVSRGNNTRFDYEYPALINVEDNAPNANDWLQFNMTSGYFEPVPFPTIDVGDALTTADVSAIVTDEINTAVDPILDSIPDGFQIYTANTTLGTAPDGHVGFKYVFMDTRSANRTLNIIVGTETTESDSVEVINYSNGNGNTTTISVSGATIEGSSTYTLTEEGERAIIILDESEGDFKVSTIGSSTGSGNLSTLHAYVEFNELVANVATIKNQTGVSGITVNGNLYEISLTDPLPSAFYHVDHTWFDDSSSADRTLIVRHDLSSSSLVVLNFTNASESNSIDLPQNANTYVSIHIYSH